MNQKSTPLASTTKDNSVFISYALADDQKPPFEDTAQGWVTFFWGQLRFELTTRGAKEAKLWLDRYQIEHAEAFTPKIERALAQAKLLITIFSENWLQSDWCKREVKFFAGMHPDASERIVPVYKSKLDHALLPDLMQGDKARVGYRFFTMDETGKLHEFYWRGLKNEDAYFEQIRQIALFIIDRLHIKPDVPYVAETISPPKSGKTLFVSVAASDLKDARQRLVNDLKASGFTVVPENDRLPETCEELEYVLKKALSKAEYAVHLIGESRGMIAEGCSEPIIDQQLQLVRETAMPRVLWVPRWLPEQKGDKRNPFEVVKRFNGLQQGEELFNGELTDFSQWLRQRFHSESSVTDHWDHSENNEFKSILVAAADDDDEDLAIDLANQLQKCGFSVQTYFCDEKIPPAQDLKNTFVFLPWGNAGGTDFEAMLEWLKASAQVVCLRLPGGDEKAKRRFFRKGIFLEKIDALPGSRSETREMLKSLGLETRLPQMGNNS